MKEGFIMTNRFSDFNSCKRIEENPTTRRVLDNFYRTLGYDFERVDFDKDYQSRALQYKGVDVILYKDGGSLYVDEKVTTKEFKGDILLEIGNANKQGWALNEKYLTNVVLFYYTNKIILIEYDSLRVYLQSNLFFLNAKYKVITSDNGKQNVIIPLEVLQRELYSSICTNTVKVFDTIEYCSDEEKILSLFK
ncbi:hypothetical protein [Clostridium omnivorum]|uniref:Type I restriction enzyme R protein N-terminal domain-containing protein n=1 Tax=Clostridium omnivorum TaxID=1604902 RepID=A0ABQ5NAE1_9CLOT|nr:hypothetical protein [Clostridium sp. E14]GLC32183.1 hypothetical protein bsdE14_35930 [Clostridium sp. E14]